jgi:GWxTD domain-containing protein
MYATFNSPEGSYIETYISTIGNSLVYKKNEKGKYQAEVEITMVFKQAEKIINVNKYILQSPEEKDSIGVKSNFIDMQRIHLPNGIYNFDLSIKDANSEQSTLTLTDIITINFDKTNLYFGGIQYIEKITPTEVENVLSKNGYDLLPYISTFFPSNVEKLSFYVELYNTDNVINDDFVLRYYIENFETEIEIDKYSRFKRMESKEIIPFLGGINISDLKSGNYNLVFDVVNRENKSLKKVKYFFQRSNNAEDKKFEELMDNIDIHSTFSGYMTSIDSMKLYVASLRPIGNHVEQRFIDHQLKYASIDILHNFFALFWYSRYNQDPNSMWCEYKAQVEFVNKLYGSSIKPGFSTDQGVIYLKYGAPNEVYESRHEPSAYPYEIWTYWRIGNQNNRKFVFYNPTIVKRDFELLHSNVTGELSTPNWEILLQKRNHDMYNYDNKTSDQSWGSRALQEFNK